MIYTCPYTTARIYQSMRYETSAAVLLRHHPPPPQQTQHAELSLSDYVLLLFASRPTITTLCCTQSQTI